MSIVSVLQAAVPGADIEPSASVDQPAVYVARDRILDVCRALRETPGLAFEFLAEVTAVDYWPREPRFEVVYLLVSIANKLRLRVKARVPGNEARIASVTGIWPSAGWPEREVHDMFGIVFDGHADLRRLLMPEDWEGHPLRKDYPVQIKMAALTSEALQVTEQEFRANLQRDRAARG